MNAQELENRNKILERRWKIVLIVAVVFVLSRPVALYIVNHFIHKAADDAKMNEYPLIDPARKFIPQEDYIINIQDLRNTLNKTASDLPPNSISLYFEYLNTGANIDINKELRLWPASLTKLPTALVAMKKVDMGEWSLDDTFEITQDDANQRSGELYKRPLGTKIALKEILELSLKNSDNTANNILKRSLSDSDRQRLIDEIGLEALFDSEGKISAKEYSRLFRALYTSSFLERKNSQQVLEWLSQSDFHDFLSTGLPAVTTFPHKWGENDTYRIYGDSGIVYLGNRSYILTVVLTLNEGSREKNLEKAKQVMREISEQTYNFIKSAK